MTMGMTALKRLPVEDRPRERLLGSGGAALSDAELLAVLLRTGRPGHSAVEMARELLDTCGGVAGLLDARGERLRRRGLGDAKAAAVLAAVELGRRLARARLPERELLDRPASLARYLTLRYDARDQEIMGALYLDVRHALIAERELYRGTMSRTAVEPRAILKEALLRGACGFVLFHTHPSGDPAPSTEDLVFTRRMTDAGKVVGVPLLDHMILAGGGRWISLQRHGGW